MRHLYFGTVDSARYKVAFPDDMPVDKAVYCLMQTSFPNDKNCSNFRMARSGEGDIVIFDTSKICGIWCGNAYVDEEDLTCKSPLHLL